MAPRFSQFAFYAAAVATSASGVTWMQSGRRGAASLTAADPIDYMDEYISGSAAAAASSSGTFVAKPVAAVLDSSGHQSDRYAADAWMHPRDTLESAAPVVDASGGAQPAQGQVFSVRLDSELQFHAHRRGDYMDQYIAGLGGKEASAAQGDQAEAAKSPRRTDPADALDFSWLHPRVEAPMETRAPKLSARTTGGDDLAGGQVINVKLDSELQFGARRGDYMDQYIAESSLGGNSVASAASGAEAAQGKQMADIDGSASHFPVSSDFFPNFWRADRSAGGAATSELPGWTQPHFAAAVAQAAPKVSPAASMEAQSASEPDHSDVINIKLDSELQEAARSRRQ